MSLWEGAAVALGIAYLLLAVRESVLCWYAAFVSTAIFLVLFWNVNLLMESALQVYYLGMAVYGWHQWRHGGEDHGELKVSTWPLRHHLFAIGSVLLLVFISGELLTRYSDAALPHLDSFTTWGAVVATFMVARKILENWIYWFVIDAVSIGLYLSRDLLFTAALFTAYLVMIVIGYRSWRNSMLESAA